MKPGTNISEEGPDCPHCQDELGYWDVVYGVTECPSCGGKFIYTTENDNEEGSTVIHICEPVEGGENE